MSRVPWRALISHDPGNVTPQVRIKSQQYIYCIRLLWCVVQNCHSNYPVFSYALIALLFINGLGSISCLRCGFDHVSRIIKMFIRPGSLRQLTAPVTQLGWISNENNWTIILSVYSYLVGVLLFHKILKLELAKINGAALLRSGSTINLSTDKCCKQTTKGCLHFQLTGQHRVCCSQDSRVSIKQRFISGLVSAPGTQNTNEVSIKYR